MENITSQKVIPMKVTDVLDGCYMIKSLDDEDVYKISAGTGVEVCDGAVIAVDSNTYFKLIVPNDEPFEENKPGNEHEDIHTWSYNETIALIESMCTHIDDLNHAKKRKYVFTLISNDLLSSGFTVTSTSCQNKWKNLRSYKAAKDNQSKTGRGPSRFQFFEKMDELLGEKPSNKCMHSLESSMLDDISEQSTSTLRNEILSSEEECAEVSAGIIQKENVKQTKRKTSDLESFKEWKVLREEEYRKKQKRHEEKIGLQKQKVELEKEKINFLKLLLEKL